MYSNVRLFELYFDKKNNILYIPCYISKNYYIESISVNDQGNTWQASFSTVKLDMWEHVQKSLLLTRLAGRHILEDLKEFIERKVSLVTNKVNPV